MSKYKPRKIAYPYVFHSLSGGSKKRLGEYIRDYLSTNEVGWIPNSELGFTDDYVMCEPDIPVLQEIERRKADKSWKGKKKK